MDSIMFSRKKEVHIYPNLYYYVRNNIYIYITYNIYRIIFNCETYMKLIDYSKLTLQPSNDVLIFKRAMAEW